MSGGNYFTQQSSHSMKKTLLFIAAAVIGFGALGIAKTGETLYKLQFHVQRIKWKGIRRGVLEIEVTVSFTNPTTKDLHITGVFLDINLPEGDKIASITQTNIQKLPKVKAKSTTNVTFPVLVPLLNFSFSLSTLVQEYVLQNKYPKSLIVTGYMDVNNVQYPVSYNYKFSE